ncbi:hypothetical protein [Anoxybacterium hadale]|uniref:hypothetical protein n=1 Tax=Anoxybacterium hadale TaxID=3408580 RepID=UPI003AFFCCC1
MQTEVNPNGKAPFMETEENPMRKMRFPQTEANPMRKNKNFRIGLMLNVMEGILSGSNFMLLYAVMQALWSGMLDMGRIYVLAGSLAAIFVMRLVIYSTGYVRSQIGGAEVSRQIRLFLGDKPADSFIPVFTGQVEPISIR